MPLLHLLLITIDAGMNSEIGSTRQCLEALSSEVPCRGRWCRYQTYPTWATRHPISTTPVARITAHAMVVFDVRGIKKDFFPKESRKI